MTDYECPACGGGFPAADAEGKCPWCGEAMNSDGEPTTPSAPFQIPPGRVTRPVRREPYEPTIVNRDPEIGVPESHFDSDSTTDTQRLGSGVADDIGGDPR
jgi:hypothetical protein